MRILLDTHILLWAGLKMARVPVVAATMIDDFQNEVVFSSASIWEIAIKRRLDRNSPTVDARTFRENLLANGYRELPINGLHAAQVQDLPSLHKDPFDRILVAQAMVEGLLLLTSDRMVARYPGPIQKV
jgi:PIN domain nuclease of toxin-antitoxin system